MLLEPTGRTPLGCRWEDNIRMGLEEISISAQYHAAHPFISIKDYRILSHVIIIHYIKKWKIGHTMFSKNELTATDVALLGVVERVVRSLCDSRPSDHHEALHSPSRGQYDETRAIVWPEF